MTEPQTTKHAFVCDPKRSNLACVHCGNAPEHPCHGYVDPHKFRSVLDEAQGGFPPKQFQPRDFYIGDPVRENWDDSADVGLRVVIAIPHSDEVLVDAGDDSSPIPKRDLVHASDGAPLGKFGGIKKATVQDWHRLVSKIEEVPHSRCAEMMLKYVNGILGAEVG